MDTINAGLFPISFNAHIVFTIISVLFFLMQYARHKQPYQLLSAIAIPLPLILYLNSSKVVFNAIGIIELVLVVVIAVMLFSIGAKEDKQKKAEAKAQKESKSNET